jgi:hypothetical protein
MTDNQTPVGWSLSPGIIPGTGERDPTPPDPATKDVPIDVPGVNSVTHPTGVEVKTRPLLAKGVALRASLAPDTADTSA